jgi:hypothetical protein
LGLIKATIEVEFQLLPYTVLSAVEFINLFTTMNKESEEKRKGSTELRLMLKISEVEAESQLFSSMGGL